MILKLQLSVVAMLGLALVGAGPAHAQQFPTKPISLVVPFAAGGPTDVVGRALAASMQKTLVQTVIIENVVDAGGTVGAARVAKSPADGYHILLPHNGMATAVGLYRKLPYDPVGDFEPISPAQSLGALIASVAWVYRNWRGVCAASVVVALLAIIPNCGEPRR